MFVIYMFLGSLLEKMHCWIGHEAGLIIIVGMSLSYGAYMIGHEEFTEMFTFDETFFFYFCLPPIIFASGYNMKRKKFFENFGNILIFGLFGTLLTFSFFAIFTYIVM